MYFGFLRTPSSLHAKLIKSSEVNCHIDGLCPLIENTDMELSAPKEVIICKYAASNYSLQFFKKEKLGIILGVAWDRIRRVQVYQDATNANL